MLFGCVSCCWFLVHKLLRCVWQSGGVLWLVGLPFPSRCRWISCHPMRHIILSFDLWRLMCYHLFLYHIFLLTFPSTLSLDESPASSTRYGWFLGLDDELVEWSEIVSSAIILLLQIYVTCAEVFVPHDFCLTFNYYFGKSALTAYPLTKDCASDWALYFR